MTPAQQDAITELMGRAPTMEEVTVIDQLLDPDNRNDVAITEIINIGQADALGSLTVEDVFDQLYESGDYMTIKSAQLANHPVAVMAFASLYDAKQIGKNLVNFTKPTTVALLNQLESAALLSVAGRAALEARATRKSRTKSVADVSLALNIAEGRMVI